MAMSGYKLGKISVLLYLLVLLTACASVPGKSGTTSGPAVNADYRYIIGAGDKLNVFVWRNPDLSVDNVPVRPDGRISSPLVEDIQASGKTPQQLAKDIQTRLAQYIKDPLVTVTVMDFVGRLEQQIRIIGEAAEPKSIPYRQNMTLLDAMIAAGGLTEYAAGNKAIIVRNYKNEHRQIPIRLEDLIRGGDISANVVLAPGDILVIPESLF